MQNAMPHSAVIVVMMLCVGVHGALAQISEVGPDEGAKRGSLGIIWEGVGDAKLGALYVTLESDDDNVTVLAQRACKLGRPAVFAGLPYGSVRVVCAPIPLEWDDSVRRGKRPKGAVAVAKALVDAPEVTVKVNIQCVNPALLSIECVGPGGAPLKGVNGVCRDVTDGLAGRTITVRADNVGVVRVLGYEGRKYRLELALGVPFRARYVSAAYTLTRVDQEVLWKLARPAALTIAAVEREDGTTNETTLKDVDILVEASGGRARVFELTKGTVTMAKEDEFLRETSALQIVLTGQSAEKYVLAEGRQVRLEEGDQCVRIVLVRRKVGEVNVSVSGVKGTVAPRAWLVATMGGGKVKAQLGKYVKLPAGQYKVVVWCPGYSIERKKVMVVDKQQHEVKVVVKPAPRLSGTVVDDDGAPVVGVRVEMRYVGGSIVKPKGVVTKVSGAFSLPLEEAKPGVMRVLSPELGCCVVEVKHKGHDLVLGKVSFVAPAVVKGKVIIEPELGRANGKAGDWVVLWVSAKHPTVVMGGVGVENGQVEAKLQPGQYLAYMVCGGEAARMRSLDCTVKAAGESVALGQCRLTVRAWATKVPLGRLGIR